MTQIPDFDRGYRVGMRRAVTILHDSAREMNDPVARAVLNTAARSIGVRLAEHIGAGVTSKYNGFEI